MKFCQQWKIVDQVHAWCDGVVHNFLGPTSDISTYITSSMYNGSVFVAPLSPKRKQKSEMQHAHTFFDVSMDFQGTYSSYKRLLLKRKLFLISDCRTVAHSSFRNNSDLFLRRFILSISLNGLYNVIFSFSDINGCSSGEFVTSIGQIMENTRATPPAKISE